MRPISVTFVDPTGRFVSLAEVSEALSVQTSLLTVAIPQIVFGGVKIVITSVLAKALKPIYEAREKALLSIADGDLAGIGYETYVAANSAIALGYRLLSMGYDAVDVTDAAASFVSSVGSLANAYFSISTSVTIPNQIRSAAERAGRVFWKVSNSPVSSILKSGVPKLIATNTVVSTTGRLEFAKAVYDAISSGNTLLQGLNTFQEGYRQ